MARCLLDETNEKVIVDLLQGLHAEVHTIIMVTRDPEMAGLADRLVRREHGRLVPIHSLHGGVRP